MGALIRRRHVATAGPTRRDISRSISNGQDRQLADLAEVGFLAECTRQQRERIASLSVTLEVSAGRRLCRREWLRSPVPRHRQRRGDRNLRLRRCRHVGTGVRFRNGRRPHSRRPAGRRRHCGHAHDSARPPPRGVRHTRQGRPRPRPTRSTRNRLSPRARNSKQHAAGTAPPQSGTGGVVRGVPIVDTVMKVLGCLGRTGTRQRNARKTRQ